MVSYGVHMVYHGMSYGNYGILIAHAWPTTSVLLHGREPASISPSGRTFDPVPPWVWPSQRQLRKACFQVHLFVADGL